MGASFTDQIQRFGGSADGIPGEIRGSIGDETQDYRDSESKVHESYALVQAWVAGGSQDCHSASADKKTRASPLYSDEVLRANEKRKRKDE